MTVNMLGVFSIIEGNLRYFVPDSILEKRVQRFIDSCRC